MAKITLPLTERFRGHAGFHTFTITEIRLCEVGKIGLEANDRASAYRFMAMGDTVESALEKLRKKISAGIKTQYLEREDERWFLAGHGLRGWITVADNADRAALSVDGHFISGEDLLRLLSTAEGGQIEITISDPMD